MLVDAVAALFFGLMYDKKGVKALVWSTLISAPFAIFVFAFHSVPLLLLGIALWGVGMGAQESILKAAVTSMMTLPGQISPNHFHWNKMEDIINRGGGNVIFRLWNATKDEQLDTTDVKVFSDGRCYTVPAGSDIVIAPGQSLTLYPYYYHVRAPEQIL